MISKDEIKKLAELARINLSEKEETALASDLRKILDYIEKLKEVDISNVPEMTHAIEQKNVFRKDETVWDEQKNKDLLTGQFPDEERGYLKVKGVFERQ